MKNLGTEHTSMKGKPSNTAVHCRGKDVRREDGRQGKTKQFEEGMKTTIRLNGGRGVW